MSSPALEQGGNRRTELVEQLTQRTTLLRVERNISHSAAVYGGLMRAAWAMPRSCYVSAANVSTSLVGPDTISRSPCSTMVSGRA